jgi:protein-tyrosine-phosphatase/predicted ATP-grasp superfamily ATP-dependent carboligase
VRVEGVDNGLTVRALVLDGHSAAALETVQSLGRGRVTVHVCSDQSDCLAFRSNYAERKIRQPTPVDAKAFTDWLKALDAENQYTLIVPATEASLLMLRWLPENDPLRLKAVIPNNECLDNALDKERTWRAARSLGIPVPDSIFIESLEGVPSASPFPLVLKPIWSKVVLNGRIVTLSAAIVDNDRDRRKHLNAWLPYVPVQQQMYVRGRGVGVEFLYNRGRKVWHFAHERIHEFPLTGGGSTYRRSITPSSELLAASEKLLNAFQWHGVAMIEYKVKPDGTFCLLEINPRLWGSLALAVDAGVDFPKGLLLLAQGERLPTQPTYRTDYFTRNFNKDIRWMKANWRTNAKDPMRLTRPRMASFFEYFRPFIGRESWDHFDIRDFPITRTILQRELSAIRASLRKQLLTRRALAQHQQVCKAMDSMRPVKSLLFVCSGNICRSPFAAQLAKAKLADYEIASSGFHHMVGRRPPDDIVEVARSMGMDISQSRSSRLSTQQIAHADLILIMDLSNYERLASEFPQALPKTLFLGLFKSPASVSIRNPYQTSESEIRRVLNEVASAVNGLSRWLKPVGMNQSR